MSDFNVVGEEIRQYRGNNNELQEFVVTSADIDGDNNPDVALLKPLGSEVALAFPRGSHGFNQLTDPFQANVPAEIIDQYVTLTTNTFQRTDVGSEQNVRLSYMPERADIRYLKYSYAQDAIEKSFTLENIGMTAGTIIAIGLGAKGAAVIGSYGLAAAYGTELAIAAAVVNPLVAIIVIVGVTAFIGYDLWKNFSASNELIDEGFATNNYRMIDQGLSAYGEGMTTAVWTAALGGMFFVGRGTLGKGKAPYVQMEKVDGVWQQAGRRALQAVVPADQAALAQPQYALAPYAAAVQPALVTFGTGAAKSAAVFVTPDYSTSDLTPLARRIAAAASLALSPSYLTMPSGARIGLIPVVIYEGTASSRITHFLVLNDAGDLAGSLSVVTDATGDISVALNGREGIPLDGDMVSAIANFFASESSSPAAVSLGGGLSAAVAGTSRNAPVRFGPADPVDPAGQKATTGLARPVVNLPKLFQDVFAPLPSEKVVVMVDRPHGSIAGTEAWDARREMAVEWHRVLTEMGKEVGFTVRPLVEFNATGAHNQTLPETALMEGVSVNLGELMADTTLVLAMTQFSATGPLTAIVESVPTLRLASMPTVSPSMMDTALAADYAEVGRRAHILAFHLTRSYGAHITFGTGHKLYIDLRYREGHPDAGQLHPRPANKGLPRPSTGDMAHDNMINLPSGEGYSAPYEGERPDKPSLTGGEIPYMDEGELVVFRVAENIITDVIGEGPKIQKWRDFFAVDPARRNIAELGLGCNDKAVISGNVIEDEKVGFHWAFGRSEHIGGTVGPASFTDPSHVVHHDLVYPKGGDIEIQSLVLDSSNGLPITIMSDGDYVPEIFVEQK